MVRTTPVIDIWPRKTEKQKNRKTETLDIAHSGQARTTEKQKNRKSEKQQEGYVVT